MPAGDAQRVWFPAMVVKLRLEWRENMPHSALIELCEELDAMLHRIRSERKILRPIIRCRSCGAERRMAEPRVSVRAMILALGRFQIVPQTQIKKLEREWAKYRKQEGLDLYGKNESGVPTEAGCQHH
jgi:hypothetical protein